MMAKKITMKWYFSFNPPLFKAERFDGVVSSGNETRDDRKQQGKKEDEQYIEDNIQKMDVKQ